MKKIFCLMIVFLMILSVFAIAQDAEPTLISDDGGADLDDDSNEAYDDVDDDADVDDDVDDDEERVLLQLK